MGAVAQLAEPRDMVGMQMRVDRLDQFEVELLQQFAIAVDFLQHGIEDQRFAAETAREQVAVGAGDAVKELTKDHGCYRRAMIPDVTSQHYSVIASEAKQSGLRKDNVLWIA